MDAFFSGLSIADVHGDIHRNIVSLRESQDLYDDLSDSAAAWQAAIDLEMAAKPPLFISRQTIIDRPFEEATYNEAIDYPFKHWSKTRYSDGSYGVWYGADSLKTSIHETVYHWRHSLLADANWQNIASIVIERIVYLVRCDAALLNFLPKIADFPALIDPSNYYQTRQVGARIHHDGHPGLKSRSARCAGDIYAIFNQRVLSTPRQLCYLTYRSEQKHVVIERKPGKEMLRIASA